MRVTTFGGGCTTKGITRTEINDLIGELRPFDVTASGDVSCPDILRTFTHEATFTFRAAGPCDDSHTRPLEPDGKSVVKIRRVRLQRRVLVDAGL